MCANEVTNQLLSSNYIDAIKKKNPAQLKQLIKDGLIIEKNNIKQLAENMNYLFSNPELINEMRMEKEVL